MKEKSTSNIKLAFLLNLFFSIIELAGGIFTNSISIISDSVHDFGDAISIGIAFLLEKKAEKEPDTKYTYGYARYSVLGGFITSVILLVGSVFVFYNAINRLINPVDVQYDGMIILAVIGLVINGLGAYKTAKGEKINEKAVSLHMLEDVLGWVAVLVGSILIKIFNLPIIDPILSILIGVYILVHVVRNLKEIAQIFLEKAPEDIDMEKIKNQIKNSSLKEIHHVHLWTLDGTNKYLTMHVVIADNTSVDELINIKNEIREILEKNNILHSTIEIEFEKEKCSHKSCEMHHNEGTCNHHHHH